MIWKTERLNFRPLRAADAPALFAILGDPEAMKFWDRPAIARTATATEIVASQLSAMEDGHFLYWTVWRGDDAIGSVDLSALDFNHRRGEIGFLFRRDQWGQGYGREEVMGALIRHAFGQLRLERLEAKVHAANMPAKETAKLVGFHAGRAAERICKTRRDPSRCRCLWPFEPVPQPERRIVNRDRHQADRHQFTDIPGPWRQPGQKAHMIALVAQETVIGSQHIIGDARDGDIEQARQDHARQG